MNDDDAGRESGLKSWRAHSRRSRELKTEEERAKRREYERRRRELETPDERKMRLERMRKRVREYVALRSSVETPEERLARLAEHAKRERTRRQQETPDERKARLERRNDAWRKRIAAMTPDELVAYKAQKRALVKRWNQSCPLRPLLILAKRRARSHNLPFDLSPEDLEYPETCPVLGIKLVRNVGNCGPIPSSPSIDRIIPELGYVKGNVRVISYRANNLKSNATVEEMRLVLADLERIHKESNHE